VLHTPNRRRFLQILAAAPFAPWKEIAEELAKPAIIYSIPAKPIIYIAHDPGFSEAAVQGIELEAWSKAIPNLFFNNSLLYTRILGITTDVERVMERARLRMPFQVMSAE
jgi:hypothetical protein